MLKNQSKQINGNIIFYLFLVHIIIIVASNYLVQIPFKIFENSFNLNTNWGTFTFPLIFLATDLTVRILGGKSARRVVLWAMLPALLISYIISILFKNGDFTSFSNLSTLDTFVARIAIASFLAYLLGQTLDISIFAKLRKNKIWWVAPILSTLFGSLLDTFLFYFIAFYNSIDNFMSNNWVGIAWFDYGFKLLISLLVFIPIYGVLVNILVKRINP